MKILAWFKRLSKKKRIIMISAIVAISVWGVRQYTSNSASNSPSAVLVQASAVRTTTLQQEAHAIGTLVARSVEITAEVSGHVEKILFEDGASVAKGSVLIQLDDAVYKAKYASARARYVYSERDYGRKVFLGKQGAIAKQAIDQAEADLKEKKADMDESEVMMNKMKLTAPFAGVVGKSKVNPGDYVNVGTSVVTLTDTKHLRIEYNIPEKYLAAIKRGQAVELTTAAYPGQVFKGKLSFISPTINSENRSVSLYADVPNDTNTLAPGMFANVTHSLDATERSVIIPARSLVPIMDGVQVFKVVDGKAVAVTVKIGKRTDTSVQVLEGLAAGDMVITDGQIKIKNGMPVKLKT